MYLEQFAFLLISPFPRHLGTPAPQLKDMSGRNFIQQLQNPQHSVGKYTYHLANENGVLLFGLLISFVIFKLLFGEGNSKNKIARSYWGGKEEISTAKKKAVKQIISPQCDSATLYVRRRKLDGIKQEKGKGKILLSVPDVQRGTAVIGAPGSGKSVSAINPMICSAMEQGFPIALYDFKYPSQAKLSAYARTHGYKVHIFAPGFPESEVCNPIDFLRDSSDAETARQIATVINKNFSLLSKNNDAFFGPSGDQLTQAVLMLAKDMTYPDVMTAAAILSSKEIIKRLMAADLNPWINIALGQIFSSVDSEKTVAGIMATASLMFTRFMAKNTLGCFVGKTTLPLQLKGKQMIIFGLDRERRYAVGPLMTSILHMIVSKNIASKRQDPLIVSIDELPSVYLPDLFKWLNESRSEGFCGLLGWQNMSQLEETYGKEITRAIFGACGTKFLFNPGEEESSRLFSNYLGDEEIKEKQKSRSSGNCNTSTSISYQKKSRKLFEASQFLKLPSGKCVFINPAYSNKDESSVPLLKKVRLPKSEFKIDAKTRAKWLRIVRKSIKHSTQKIPTKDDLIKRVQEVNRVYPLLNQSAQPENKHLTLFNIRDYI